MAHRGGGYALDPKKPAFSMLDDDDMTSEFMNSSSATFLAADRLPPGPEQQAAQEAEMRRQQLLHQMRQVEKRTLDSAKRSKGLLYETERVGIETAEELVKQREQLSNTEQRLDTINDNLKDTQKNINGIKSVFSSLKTWWTTPKQPVGKDTKEDSATSPVESGAPSVTSNPHLGPAYERSQTLVSAQMATTHPGLRLKGLEEDDDEDPDFSNFRENAKKVNAQLDSDLDEMSMGLSRLKGLAEGLGAEIVDQNSMLDRIHGKVEKADTTIGSQNVQIKKILKR
ncbi:synaptosomal-associated protein 29 [Procambarus clarkii]|uniref:synaptosomal-associated protein 29 n=1 Tax=Procambarus clarkii TaxID=6728 RepID=UPI001E67152F|nr:synaptosomal-associated protein 29-like isoform X1 [Procambarus clarkii]